MAIKNRIDADNELEFILPNEYKTIRLKINEFINSKTNEITNVIHAGQDPVIKIPLEWFVNINYTKEQIMYSLPPLTLIRKTKQLTELEKDRIKQDKISFLKEINGEDQEGNA